MTYWEEKLDDFELFGFLKNNFSKNIQNFSHISGGENSRAYAFDVDTYKFIFRINPKALGFEKDKFSYDHFSKYIDIPRVHKIGKHNRMFFCISERFAGEALSANTNLSSTRLTNDIISNLHKIHNIKIPQKCNYGVLDKKGIAEFDSWDEWVLKDYILVTKKTGDYFTWDEACNKGLLDRTLIEQVFKKIKELLVCVPKRKYLLHGDYANGNIIISGEKVTGVIDWSESAYGDFLYDVAWLDFWLKKPDLLGTVKDFYLKQNVEIDKFNERIKCHKLFIGIHTLGIYSLINDKGKYKDTLSRFDYLIK